MSGQPPYMPYPEAMARFRHLWATVGAVATALNLEGKNMSDIQNSVDAETAAITVIDAQLAAAHQQTAQGLTLIQAEVTALQAQIAAGVTAPDLTALNAAISQAASDANVTVADAAAVAAVAPAPAPAPAPDPASS